MLDINVKELVDEAGKVLPGALTPVLDGFLDKFFEQLKGRVIKVTIVDNALTLTIQ